MEADTESLKAIADGQIGERLEEASNAFLGGDQERGVQLADRAVHAFSHLQALLAALGHKETEISDADATKGEILPNGK